MSESLGPIEICCDAPDYAVVRGCRLLGFHRPADVRWCRLRDFRSERPAQSQAPLLGFLFSAFGKRIPEQLCCCGGPLPILREVCMTFNTGFQAFYRMGQCPRCHTIFWDEG